MIAWITEHAQTILIADLALSAVVLAVRGLLGTTRTYTIPDAILGVLEIAFMIWLVTVIAS